MRYLTTLCAAKNLATDNNNGRNDDPDGRLRNAIRLAHWQIAYHVSKYPGRAIVLYNDPIITADQDGINWVRVEAQVITVTPFGKTWMALSEHQADTVISMHLRGSINWSDVTSISLCSIPSSSSGTTAEAERDALRARLAATEAAAAKMRSLLQRFVDGGWVDSRDLAEAKTESRAAMAATEEARAPERR